ncbi:MAG: hypothetical protein IJV94_00380 [Bacilli bacterium]|nr:hypothetical protein [Bacilli bacterium]
MKIKLINKFIFGIAVLLSISSCTINQNSVENKIKSAYLSYLTEAYNNTDDYDKNDNIGLNNINIEISKYYGNFNGAHIALINCNLGYYYMSHKRIQPRINQLIGGIPFEFESYNNMIYVYKNKSLYTLKNAYDNGVINHKTLQKISEQHKIQNNYGFLSKDKENELTEIFKNYYNVDSLDIVDYYGIYNDTYILVISSLEIDNSLNGTKAENYEFAFNNNESIYFYKNDSFYTLNSYISSFGIDQTITHAYYQHNYKGRYGFENIDDNLERKYINALEFKIPNDGIYPTAVKYYGKAGNYDLFYATNQWWPNEKEKILQLGDYIFSYSETKNYYIFHENIPYTLSEAYESEIINDEDIKSFYYTVYNQNLNNSIDDNLEDDIIKSYFDKYIYGDGNSSQITFTKSIALDYFGVVHHLGNYNNSHVVILGNNLQPNNSDKMQQIYDTINGKTFVYEIGGNKILVYKNHDLYSLSEAFNNNLINDKDLEDIYNKHSSLYPDQYLYAERINKVKEYCSRSFDGSYHINGYFKIINDYEIYLISTQENQNVSYGKISTIEKDYYYPILGSNKFYGFKNDELVPLEKIKTDKPQEIYEYIQLYYEYAKYDFDTYTLFYKGFDATNEYGLSQEEYIKFLLDLNTKELDKILYLENDYVFFSVKENCEPKSIKIYNYTFDLNQEIYVYYRGKTVTLNSFYVYGILSKDKADIIYEAYKKND